jgi:UDP-N-acetylmuramoyl-tripeptide--D-alanyl-D-alanine ligase
MMQFLLATAIACWLASTLRHLIDVLHFFQQHEYDNVRFFKWSFTHWKKIVWPIELSTIPVLLISSVLFGLSQTDKMVVAVVILWGGVVSATFLLGRKHRAKVINPLVNNSRAKRLLTSGLVIVFGEAFLILGVLSNFSLNSRLLNEFIQAKFTLYLTSLIVVGQLAFVNIVFANILLFPLESLTRAYYVRSARQRIRAINPVVIGITGSYGKTSTKEILAHLLSSRYDVLRTPKSYNTLMGICKVIREDLQPKHQYFVVELGAYKPGEIAKLCRLVKPHIGILTAIGPQHLERFRTIENVVKAKNELIEALPEGGIAIFNGDDPICLRLSKITRVKVRRYGTTPGGGVRDLLAQNMEVDSNGTRFEIVHNEQKPQSARTMLLGRHNISNVLGATLAALECDISLREAIQSLAVFPPIEHRLQLVKGPNGIIYIDDTYNSNPVGAALALEVLATFNGRKFLVTPGFVELGSLESEENKRLGRKAVTVCDYAFLVGSLNRVGDILEGLKQGNFDDARIFVIDSLDQARHKLREIVIPGDVILFENDLPDIY